MCEMQVWPWVLVTMKPVSLASVLWKWNKSRITFILSRVSAFVCLFQFHGEKIDIKALPLLSLVKNKLKKTKQYLYNLLSVSILENYSFLHT